MKKITSGVLVALVAAGTFAAAPAASAIAPTRGDGQLVARCQGRVVKSGKLFDAAGHAHPTMSWRLYRTGARGTTLCFQMFDRAGARTMMSGSISKGSSYAYENTMYTGKSRGFLMHHAKGQAVTFDGATWGEAGEFTTGVHTVTYR